MARKHIYDIAFCKCLSLYLVLLLCRDQTCWTIEWSYILVSSKYQTLLHRLVIYICSYNCCWHCNSRVVWKDISRGLWENLWCIQGEFQIKFLYVYLSKYPWCCSCFLGILRKKLITISNNVKSSHFLGWYCLTKLDLANRR